MQKHTRRKKMSLKIPHERKRPVFKVSPGNMFTKAQPNSLWQGTEEKVTACAAAKFRRFKKVLLYLPWMWLMLGRPRESRWLIHCYFQRRGDRGFLQDSLKLREMHALSGELAISICSGKGLHYSRQYTNAHRVYCRGHKAGNRLIPHRMCGTRDSRGQTVNESKPGSIQNVSNLAEMQSSRLSAGLLLDEI